MTVVVTSAAIVGSVAILLAVAQVLPPPDLGRGLLIAVIIPILLAPPLSFSFLRLLDQLDRSEAANHALVEELQETLQQVRRLGQMLPICASCKNVRDDAGYWHGVEDYVREHSSLDFSHGICPGCVERLYPEHAEAMLGNSRD